MKDISREQWLVLGMTWLGWVFDAMDATIYSLVLTPALSELLPASGHAVTPETIGWYGGIIFSIFLMGWAIGGVVFGILADRIGRTKVLIITILLYAGFTGLAALSTSWWDLALYRFLTALGIGGEWAAGAALVAETWPDHVRAKAAGFLQSAWAVGFFVAAAAHLGLSASSWRVLFLVGLLPAVVALFIRLWVPEPKRWASQVHERANTATPGEMIRALFQGALCRHTLIGSALAGVAVWGVWSATNWAPTLLRSLPELRGLEEAEVATQVGWAIVLMNLGAIPGYLCFGPLADRFGRRPIFALYCIGSLCFIPLTFLTAHTYAEVVWLLPALSFFTSGIFSGFPIYLPELYPTRLRATGAGFCFNAGRVFAAGGPLVTGYLTGVFGSFGPAAAATALVYVVGLALLPFAPETKGRPLPD
jgi:MFS family permease